jgi:hypothetical protein
MAGLGPAIHAFAVAAVEGRLHLLSFRGAGPYTVARSLRSPLAKTEATMNTGGRPVMSSNEAVLHLPWYRTLSRAVEGADRLEPRLDL